jgi:hypothetical protein
MGTNEFGWQIYTNAKAAIGFSGFFTALLKPRSFGTTWTPATVTLLYQQLEWNCSAFELINHHAQKGAGLGAADRLTDRSPHLALRLMLAVLPLHDGVLKPRVTSTHIKIHRIMQTDHTLVLSLGLLTKKLCYL